MNVRAWRKLFRDQEEDRRRINVIAERLGISFGEEEETIKASLPPVAPHLKQKMKKKTQKKTAKKKAIKKAVKKSEK